jgi:hypothetical protein
LADVQLAQMQALATDLIQHRVAVLVAVGALSPTFAAKTVTSTIPIVFVYGGDPVKDGLVASLNRPGSNVTGVTFIATEFASKRLELLHECIGCLEKRLGRNASQGGFRTSIPPFFHALRRKLWGGPPFFSRVEKEIVGGCFFRTH